MLPLFFVLCRVPFLIPARLRKPSLLDDMDDELLSCRQRGNMGLA
jgi:hypothetical protein